jgi:hypothetical protein
MLGLIAIAAAQAGATLEGTAVGGARAAPESGIPLPAEWESNPETSALAAVLLDARFTGVHGPWAAVALDVWAYAPETEATLVDAAPALGWRGSPTAPWRLETAVRYDLEWFPNLESSSSGRADALARIVRPLKNGTLAPDALVVDRRFSGTSLTDFSTGELGCLRRWTAGRGVQPEVRVAVQGNAAGALGSVEATGLQERTAVGVSIAREHWELALEHRLILAQGGEIESERQPIFTPSGEYSDDVDALSAGGFVQNRLDLSGAWIRGPWRASMSLLGRFRSTQEEEELQYAYGRAIQGRIEARRELGSGIEIVANGGIVRAASAVDAYTDGWLWAGIAWHLPASDR